MTITKIRPEFTLDETRLTALRALIPEACADGQLNWDVLHEALGEHLEDEEPEAEHFALTWPGKREARRAAAIPPAGTLTPDPGAGVNEAETHHLFIEGDNLEVLKLLRKSYAGRVKLIYIDPPYNTGNDFIYPDDYAEPLQAYLRRTGQADEEGLLTSNTRASGRFHSDWLSMMYPRLRLARDLLREDGAIFVSIDDNEVHNLRHLMDEVFGEGNFIGKIVIRSNPRGRQSEKFLATVHEYLLVYAKDFNQCELFGAPLSDKQTRAFKYRDEEGKRYRLLGLRQRGSASLREERPAMFFPIYVDPNTKKVSLDRSDRFHVEVLPRKSTGEDGRWMWGSKKVGQNLDVLEAKLISTRNEWDVFVRDFLKASDGEERTRKFKTIWASKSLNYQNGKTELKNLFEGKAPFDHPKPTALLKSILTMGGEEGLVLDFFSGSCTTAHAVLDLNHEDGGNRRFIMVQLPEPTDDPDFPTIADIGRERIRRVIAQMEAGDAAQIDMRPDEDLGFKAYRLARSNFKPWKTTAPAGIDDVQAAFDTFETPLVEGWQRRDLLTEILLMEGFPLDSTVTPQPTFEHNHVLLVTAGDLDHRLWICLDAAIAPQTIAQLDLADKDLFICLDAALNDETKVQLSDAGAIHVI